MSSICKTPNIATVKIQADNLHLQALLHGNDAASVEARARDVPALGEHAQAGGSAASHRDPGEDVLALDAWSGAAARTLSASAPALPATMDAAGLDGLADHILAPLS